MRLVCLHWLLLWLPYACSQRSIGYDYFPGLNTWADAETKCGNRTLEKLAEPRSREAYDLILDHINAMTQKQIDDNSGTRESWLGGRKRPGGAWIWVSDDEKISPTFWEAGEPQDSGSTEMCLLQTVRGWKAVDCTEKRFYTCQVGQDPTTTIASTTTEAPLPELSVWPKQDVCECYENNLIRLTCLPGVSTPAGAGLVYRFYKNNGEVQHGTKPSLDMTATSGVFYCRTEVDDVTSRDSPHRRLAACSDAPTPCGAVGKDACKEEGTSYTCGCTGGYQNSTIDLSQPHCVDKNECDPEKQDNPCENEDGSIHKCINSPGSYSCECNEGYVHIGDNEQACVVPIKSAREQNIKTHVVLEGPARVAQDSFNWLIIIWFCVIGILDVHKVLSVLYIFIVSMPKEEEDDSSEEEEDLIMIAEGTRTWDVDEAQAGPLCVTESGRMFVPDSNTKDSSEDSSQPNDTVQYTYDVNVSKWSNFPSGLKDDDSVDYWTPFASGSDLFVKGLDKSNNSSENEGEADDSEDSDDLEALGVGITIISELMDSEANN